MPKQNIKVIKIGNDSIINRNKNQNFPRMNHLYLELLENKNKINPEFHHREFQKNNDFTIHPENGYQTTDQPLPSSPILPQPDSLLPDSPILHPPGSPLPDSPILPPPDSPIPQRSPNEYHNSPGNLERNDIHPIQIEQPVQDTTHEEDDNLSVRLKELLGGNSPSMHSSPNHSPMYKSPIKKAPSLQDLEEQNVNTNVLQDADDDLKRELLFKFELLKKSYKDADIPEFTIHTDYNTMNHTYQNTVRRLTLDSTVENYKMYLIGGFMLTEFILGKYLKLDMQGFTNQQMVNMNSYEKLLIELGEKSYVPEGPEWSVEMRLLFLIIMNAAIFIVSKMIMKKTGSNIMNMMNNMNSSSTYNDESKKRKMKPPDIDLDNLM